MPAYAPRGLSVRDAGVVTAPGSTRATSWARRPTLREPAQSAAVRFWWAQYLADGTCVTTRRDATARRSARESAVRTSAASRASAAKPRLLPWMEPELTRAYSTVRGACVCFIRGVRRSAGLRNVRPLIGVTPVQGAGQSPVSGGRFDLARSPARTARTVHPHAGPWGVRVESLSCRIAHLRARYTPMGRRAVDIYMWMS